MGTDRPRTLEAMDRAGLDLRLWCFRCARGAVVDSIIWRLFEARGWSGNLDQAAGDWSGELDRAARRFRCTGCQRSDAVRIFPATRPPRAPSTAADVVAGYFHACRSEAKRRRREARRIR